MISVVNKTVTFLYVSQAEASSVLNYLGWTDYMLTKLYHPEDEGVPALNSKLIQEYLKQLELCLWLTVHPNYSTSPQDTAVVSHLYDTRQEIAILFVDYGILFGFSKKFISSMVKQLPRTTLQNLAVTLDRRHPERRLGQKSTPILFNQFLNAISGGQVTSYAMAQNISLFNSVRAAIKHTRFTRLQEALKNMAPFLSQLSPWLAVMAQDRRVSTSWLQRYLGAVKEV
jgi:hypothetical protein